ncbi:MAG: T9SS type A sorting domain-containing protein [Candidatus Eisenbacteria bacterium]|nr:T9SS type A sorting domain-containing protein [Candidatus Latescibacterota bacterium]MBD3301201.1 T9SS type A sorting domain-containing protein [Candidatus Eisenbacteria bacterium]
MTVRSWGRHESRIDYSRPGCRSSLTASQALLGWIVRRLSAKPGGPIMIHSIPASIGRLATASFLLFVATPRVTPAEPLGPVLEFLGHRYALGRGGAAFDQIAFHPTDRTIASYGKIRDLCGEPISDGPSDGTGLCYDFVTGDYLATDLAGVVVRWEGDAIADTLFAVPPTFEVPGWGPDSLVSARGIAADETHVFLVDAGPDPGEIGSGVWFKFARDGTPITSSRLTDFDEHLDMDPDALLDGLAYVPENSPVAPGLLLVALEHSGIHVIDTDGWFVDKMLWSEQGIGDGIKPDAFAGITIDPTNGDLYMTDNDRTLAQVWTRLGSVGEPVSYVVCQSYEEAFLQHPAPDCNRPLWRPYAGAFEDPPGTFFGLAYRSSDRLVYGINFNDGKLYTFDPREGDLDEVGSIGVEGCWGLTFDEERDLLYVGEELSGDVRIHAVDPSALTRTPLAETVGFYTTDLAFDPSSGSIYGVACGAEEPQLIRIDRNTGAGTAVGPTACTSGLAFDPVSERLIGIEASPRMLWSIDPTTGEAEELGEPVQQTGFEGLATVTVPAEGPTSVEPRSDGRSAVSLSLSPNPFLDGCWIRLVLDRRQSVRIAIHDASGRRVKALREGLLPAGVHRVRWDGRDGDRRPVSPGIYLVRIRTEQGTTSRKLVRLR